MRKLILALAGAFLLAGTVAAEDPIGSGVGTQAGRKDEYEIDEAIRLNKLNDVFVNLQSRGVNFTRILVRNAPSAADVAGASRLSSSRPIVVVFFESKAASRSRVFLEVSLDDEQGTAVLTCKRSANLDPDDSDDLTVCAGQPMYTRDWARVTRVHLRASVVNKDESHSL